MAVGHYAQQYKKNKMKKTLLILLLFISTASFTQCVQLKKVKKMKISNKELVFPEMTDEYEKITPSQLKKIQTEKQIAENQKTKANTSVHDTNYLVVKKEYDVNKDCLISYSFNDKEHNFGTTIYQKINPDGKEEIQNSMYFTEVKTFNSGGKLKSKELTFRGGKGDITVLKQFEYDENGNLLKAFDVSKIYRLSLIDILKILERNNLFIDFNRAGGFGAEGIAPTSIQYGDTNYGKIWSVMAKADSFAAIIYDDNGEAIIHRFDTTPEQPMPFRFFSKLGFDNYYGGKTIEEVEKETGLKIFVSY